MAVSLMRYFRLLGVFKNLAGRLRCLWRRKKSEVFERIKRYSFWSRFGYIDGRCATDCNPFGFVLLLGWSSGRRQKALRLCENGGGIHGVGRCVKCSKSNVNRMDSSRNHSNDEDGKDLRG